MKLPISLLLASLVACAAEQPHTVTLANESPKPVATVDASILPPSEHVQTSAHACVMLYECDCNAGCTEIDRAASELRSGMRVRVLSGPLKDETVFVARSETDTGEHVFTIQRADPSSPIIVCGTPRSGMLGYLCGTKDGGRARACSACSP